MQRIHILHSDHVQTETYLDVQSDNNTEVVDKELVDLNKETSKIVNEKEIEKGKICKGKRDNLYSFIRHPCRCNKSTSTYQARWSVFSPLPCISVMSPYGVYRRVYSTTYSG